MTDYKARAAFEKEKNRRRDSVLSSAHGWSSINQDFMDKLIKSWIEKY
jgi:hypothetical protein